MFRRQSGCGAHHGYTMLRVLVLSADVGEGHLAAARAIAEGLEQHDAEVIERDGLVALGRTARHIIRDGYRMQLRLAPWSYSLMYTLFNRVAISRRVGELVLSRLGRRRLLALVTRRRARRRGLDPSRAHLRPGSRAAAPAAGGAAQVPST